MVTKQFRTPALWLFSAGILAALVYYLYANADKYLEFLRLTATGVAALFMLSLAFPFINGLINKYMFQCLGATLTYREGFFLAAAATLANQLPVPGGIVTRGVYLKYKHNLSYGEYFSAQLALFLGSIAVNGCIGVGILLYWFFIRHSSISWTLLIAYALMAACIFVFRLPALRLRLPETVRRRLGPGLEGWALISRNRGLVVRLLGMQTGAMLLLAVRYWTAFQMLSQAVTLSQATLFSSASILTQLVTFAPGGLGVREAIVGGIASALGFDLAVSVAAVGLDRLVATATIVLTGWIGTIGLAREFSGAAVQAGGGDPRP